MRGSILKVIRIHLHEEDPNGETIIHIHAASRKNMTRAKEKEKHVVSPVAGQRPTIEKRLYINQIKMCIFLNGGYALLNDNAFRKSLDNLTIMEDDGDMPHPATIVCDYICNGHYVSCDRPAYRTLLRNALVFETFEHHIFDLHLFNIDSIAKEKRWDTGFVELCSLGMPESISEQFFNRMKQEKYNPAKSILAVVESFRPYVSERISMPQLAERLNLVIEQTEYYLEDEPYNELKANLLLYLDAIYTHLGKTSEVNRTRQLFSESIVNISQIDVRERLITKFLNREIVSAQDAYDFENGERCYHVLEDFYSRVLENDSILVHSLVDMYNVESVPNGKSIEYGRAIGSYLQLLTHKYAASLSEKQSIKQECEALLPKCIQHFPNGNDMNKAHQNICDYFTQIGEFKQALNHLFQSVSDAKDSSIIEQVEIICDVAGPLGNNGINGQYLFLHLMQLLHAMAKEDACIDDIHWTMLYDIIEKRKEPTIGNMNHLLGGEYPGCSILWHVAACMARRGDNCSKESAKEILSTVYNQIKDYEMPIRSISVAVKAETLALGMLGFIPGNDWKDKTQLFLTNLSDSSQKGLFGSFNPFTHSLCIYSDTSMFDTLIEITDIVAY